MSFEAVLDEDAAYRMEEAVMGPEFRGARELLFTVLCRDSDQLAVLADDPAFLHATIGGLQGYREHLAGMDECARLAIERLEALRTPLRPVQ